MRKFICSVLVFCSLLVSLISCGGNETHGEYCYRPTKVSYVGEKGEYSIQITYNENGMPIEEVAYKLGKVDSTRKLTYDDKGNLLKTSTSYTDNDEFFDDIVYTYDADGKCIYFEMYNSSIDVDKYCGENEYDENGRCVKMTLKNEVGEIDTIFETAYDDSGKILKEITKVSTATTTTDYVYDESGKLVKKITKHEDQENEANNSTTEALYSYDENGNLISEDYGNGQSITYFYDDNNNLVRVEMPNDYALIVPTKKRTFDIKYDKNNNISEIDFISYNGKEKNFKFEYEYVFVPFDGKVNLKEDLQTLFSKLDSLSFEFEPIIINPNLKK